MVRKLLTYMTFAILSFGFLPIIGADEAKPVDEDYYELARLLMDTLDEVERNYVKEVSRRELVEAAIEGVLSKLDPYSSYIDRDEMRGFRTSVESEFGGIGIQIGIRNGNLTVLSPLVGTPAYRAGIMAGDWITKIGGEMTEGLVIDQAVKRLKGKAGTDVTLTVVHSGQSEEHQLTVTREVIRVETVMGHERDEDDSWDYVLNPESRIGYIRVSAFSRTTVNELRKALDELKAEEIRGLILDLRFNPGGLLSSAVLASDLFVSEGRIVSTEGRNSPFRKWDAHKVGTYSGFSMVVLVNGYSASASEIVAACLQDHDRAVIMGERTYGKGSVQNVIELKTGRQETPQSALKLTTAGYMRPSGKNIDRDASPDDSDEWGVKPDKGYELKLTDQEMFALLRDRRQRDIVRMKNESENTSEQAASNEGTVASEEAEFTDPHLKMAIDHLTTELAQTEATPPEAEKATATEENTSD